MRTRLWLSIGCLACTVSLIGCGGDAPRTSEKETSSDSTTERSTRPATEDPPAETDDSPSAASTDGDALNEDVRALLVTVRDGNAAARRTALTKLGTSGDAARDQRVYDAINERITDGDAEVRAAAGLAMLALRGTKGVPWARPLLRDESEDVRIVMIDEIGKLGPTFADELTDALDGDVPDIQEIVFERLAAMKSKRGIARAVTLYGETESEGVRYQIARYLLACDTDAGCAAVADAVDYLRGSSAIVAALRYLGAKGKAKHLDEIGRFLRNDHDAVKIETAALVTKRKFKDADTVANLIKLLASDNAAVRRAGHDALRALTNQSFGYDPAEPDADKRAPAAAKWRAWFLDNEDKLSQE